MLRLKNLTLILVLLESFFVTSQRVHAEEVDQELLNSLKIEANHNLNRLKNLEDEKKSNKVFDNEREKSLGLFLEEQEKWDLIRERGVGEFRKQKKQLSPADDGPEYQADMKEKKRLAEKVEQSRQVQVRTRNQVQNQNADLITKLESEELGLIQLRPRYDVRKRGQNKWIKNGSNKGSTSSSSSGSGYTPPSNDFESNFPPPPPPVDYVPAPPPMDNFEDVPPPPPPNYDYGAGAAAPYDSGFGDVPPPPPPPPVDFDF